MFSLNVQDSYLQASNQARCCRLQYCLIVEPTISVGRDPMVSESQSSKLHHFAANYYETSLYFSSNSKIRERCVNKRWTVESLEGPRNYLFPLSLLPKRELEMS